MLRLSFTCFPNQNASAKFPSFKVSFSFVFTSNDTQRTLNRDLTIRFYFPFFITVQTHTKFFWQWWQERGGSKQILSTDSKMEEI
jgi:hypothetical protein